MICAAWGPLYVGSCEAVKAWKNWAVVVSQVLKPGSRSAGLGKSMGSRP